MSKIKTIHAREILDSKGEPTVEVEVTLEDGTVALAGVPSGASTGATEALELRDGDPQRYGGKGVLKAVDNVNTKIAKVLLGKDASNQRVIDQTMIDLDGTESKSHLGGNAVVAVSMAVCMAAAKSQGKKLYQYFGQLQGNNKFVLPQPQILIMEGGKHGNWATDIQEYMVVPLRTSLKTFAKRLQAAAEIFYATESILLEKGYCAGVGYEGGFCPQELRSNEEVLEIIIQGIDKAGYKPGAEVSLAIDGAATSFFNNGKYILRSEGGLTLKPREWRQKLIEWTKKYPICSIEDGLAEEDWSEWVYLTSQLGDRVQIVGDDLLTTNVKRIRKAIELKAVNSVLIKPNQIGTVTETLEAIKLSDSAGFTTVISHRSGETNDDMIADLVVGTTSWQSKFGGPDRGERLAKYNRLLRIEEELSRK